MQRPDAGAFVDGPRLIQQGTHSGPLAGSSFTAKELFDVVGLRSGAGNPTRRLEIEPASANAPAVQKLLDAGADLTGTTITVEFAWSLTGVNRHDGTPDNPADPYGVPGGSSAGAAAATAAGLCDIALGTDTGGSVRVPAAYCGLLGIRPTHGRVDTHGVVALSPSLDTVGWFARDPQLFETVGRVLLTDPGDAAPANGVVLLRDAFALADSEVSAGLDGVVGAVADQVGGSLIEEDLASPETWQEWLRAFSTIQMAEAWSTHGAFYRRHGPDALGPDVAERFETASRVLASDVAAATAVRAEVAARLEEATDGGRQVLVMPAANSRAPRRATVDTDHTTRHRLLQLTSIASLAGAPAVTFPARTRTGTQVGLSIMGAPGADEMLLSLARRVFELLSY